MAEPRVKILSFIFAAAVTMGFSLVYAQGQAGNPAGPPDMAMGGPPGAAGGGGPAGLSSMPDEVENLMTAAILSDGETVTTEKNNISPSTAVDISGKTAKNATINAPDSHESGLIVRNGGSFTLKNSAIEKSSGPLTYQVGESDEGDGKSFLAGGMFGINSAVLAYGEGSTATLENVDIKIASPEDPEQVHGSNGVFANMHGEIFLKNVDIDVRSRGGHGTDATNHGILHLDNVGINTTGRSASALTTDSPGGTIYANNVTAVVSGNLSAGIYCDGGASMEIADSSLEAKADAAMVICNDGVVNLTNVTLTGMAQAVKIHFRNGMAKSAITNGTLVSTDGEGILFDGGWGEITIENTTITPARGKYMIASQIGSHDRQKGEGIITVKNSELRGDIYADAANDASLEINLAENSTLTGVATDIILSIGAGSKWTATGDSAVTLKNVDSINRIDAGKGVTITYRSGDGCPLKGDYQLASGGKLVGK